MVFMQGVEMSANSPGEPEVDHLAALRLLPVNAYLVLPRLPSLQQNTMPHATLRSVGVPYFSPTAGSGR